MRWLSVSERNGFTLIEITVVVAIVGILATMLFASFEEARQQSRDKIRKSELKELQLAVELYKAQNGQYPVQGCGIVGGYWTGPGPVGSWGVACDEYIVGLTPSFIAELPTDPNREQETDHGYFYITDATQSAYKIMVYGSVENQLVTSFTDEFSRCPSTGTNCLTAATNAGVYAVYSAGAESW
jgi:general secretion pathway protein G